MSCVFGCLNAVRQSNIITGAFHFVPKLMPAPPCERVPPVQRHDYTRERQPPAVATAQVCALVQQNCPQTLGRPSLRLCRQDNRGAAEAPSQGTDFAVDEQYSGLD